MLFRLADTPAHILGSMHALPEVHKAWPPVWLETWKSSQQLVVETRFDLFQGITDGEWTQGESLRQYLGDENFAKVRDVWESFGRDVDVLDRVKPWLVLMVLNENLASLAGFHSKLGIDWWVLQDALNVERKPVLALETVDAGIDCSRSLPLDEQIQLLNYFCDDLTRARSWLITIYESWVRGNILQLAEFVEARRKLFPRFFERLLDQRNNAWMPQILDVVKSGIPSLVVIGALHCVGAGSVIEQLAEHGFSIQLMHPVHKQQSIQIR